MWKLAPVLFPIIATMAAGVAVLVGLVAPSLGLATMDGLLKLALGGFVAGLPLSLIVAALLARSTRRLAAL